MANKIPVLVWTVCVLAIIPNGECASRRRRSVFQFREMINCVSGGSSSEYIWYGCHCGPGGGGDPVDDTDRCCRDHDQCYKNLEKAELCDGRKDLYFVRNENSLSNCDSDNPKITCLQSSGENKECADGLCECDKKAAFCFRWHRNSFSYQYVLYKKGLYCRKE